MRGKRDKENQEILIIFVRLYDLIAHITNILNPN